MKLILPLVFVFSFGSLWAQDLEPETANKRPDPVWVKSYASKGFLSTSMDIDPELNLYTGGSFQSYLICPDTVYEMATKRFRETSPNQLFVQKHNQNGDLQWTAYADGQARLNDLVIGVDGDIFITGEVWSEDLLFVSSNGRRDSLKKPHKEYERGLYLAQFSPDGLLKDAVFFSDLPSANGVALAQNSKGQIWLAGNYFYREESELKRSWLLLSFNPNLSLSKIMAGDSSGRSGLSSIAIDSRDQLYLGAWYAEHLSFMSVKMDLEHQSQKPMLAKLNPEGDLIWCNTAIVDPNESGSHGVINDLHVDFWHRVYFTGQLWTYFIGKLDRDGGLDWMKTSTGRSSYAFGMERIEGDLLVYGHGYGSTFTSLKSAPSYSYQAKASTDFFILREGRRGKLKQAAFNGGMGTDYITAVKWHKGKLYALGHDLGGPAIEFGDQSLEKGQAKMWLACFEF